MGFFAFLTNIGNFVNMNEMKTGTRTADGKRNKADEVTGTGLRLPEGKENRMIALRAAIRKGMKSGEAEGFDADTHIKSLKTSIRNV